MKAKQGACLLGSISLKTLIFNPNEERSRSTKVNVLAGAKEVAGNYSTGGGIRVVVASMSRLRSFRCNGGTSVSFESIELLTRFSERIKC